MVGTPPPPSHPPHAPSLSSCSFSRCFCSSAFLFRPREAVHLPVGLGLVPVGAVGPRRACRNSACRDAHLAGPNVPVTSMKNFGSFRESVDQVCGCSGEAFICLRTSRREPKRFPGARVDSQQSPKRLPFLRFQDAAHSVRKPCMSTLAYKTVSILHRTPVTCTALPLLLAAPCGSLRFRSGKNPDGT